MDKQFIKMCEKAIEIQKEAPKIPEVDSGRDKWNEYFDIQGSVFWLPKENEFALLHWDNDEGRYIIGGYYSNLEGMIWLPHQDQLLEILESGTIISSGNPSLILQTVGFLLKENKYYIKFTSMEQLWLAFVIKIKYNKTWNGEDWRSS